MFKKKNLILKKKENTSWQKKLMSYSLLGGVRGGGESLCGEIDKSSTFLAIRSPISM